jgi:hypothetical protein
MKIRKASYIIFFALVYLLIHTGTVVAYELEWYVIQHRVYESQENGNRLSFEIKDDYGNYVYIESAVTNVVLKYPNGSNVTLSELMFDLYTYYRSSFNPDNSEWNYNSPIQLSDFYADIESPLVIGTYTLEVTMENGQILTTTINFDFLLDLPIISYRTFQIHTDSSGNVHWTWQIPEKLLNLAKSYDLRVRPGIAAMSGGELVALYFPSLPVEVGYAITPANIFQDLVNQADEIRFAFQARTTNNNARSYSKRIIISNPSSTVSIVPKKTAVVIPLN